MKEEGKHGKAFGQWIGRLIREYQFIHHIFASSFYKSNVAGVEETCPECLTGGLVFKDHYALKFLDPYHTSLDLTGLSKVTFFLGFLGKEKFPHDFVLIQDDVLFKQPDLADQWRQRRHVKFVGAPVSNKDRPYSAEEWRILKSVDWLELNPPQMAQWLEQKAMQ